MAAWVDTLTRQLSHAASGIIEPTLRGICDLFLLFLVCAYLLWLAPITFMMLAAWLVVGVVVFDLAIRGLVRAKGYQYTVTSEELTREFNDLASGFNEFWALRSYKFFHQRIRKKLTIIISNYVTVAVLSMAPRPFSRNSPCFRDCADPFHKRSFVAWARANPALNINYWRWRNQADSSYQFGEV